MQKCVGKPCNGFRSFMNEAMPLARPSLAPCCRYVRALLRRFTLSTHSTHFFFASSISSYSYKTNCKNRNFQTLLTNEKYKPPQKTMTSAYDDNIPVAIATPEFVTDHHVGSSAPALLPRGRSSRVIIPGESASNHVPLGSFEIDSLKAQGFTMGLINSMQRNNQVFPMRIWVADNSGASTLERMVGRRQV